MEHLQKNPYYAKYAAKMKQLQELVDLVCSMLLLLCAFLYGWRTSFSDSSKFQTGLELQF